MSPRAQVLGNLPKERPDVPTSPTYILRYNVYITLQYITIYITVLNQF